MTSEIPSAAPEVIAGRIQRRILGSTDDNPHIAVIGPSRSGKDFLVRHLILGTAKPLGRAINLDVKPFHAPIDGCGGRGDHTYCGWGIDVGRGCELEQLPEHLGTRRYRVLVPGGYESGRAAVLPVLAYVSAVRQLILLLSDAGRITEPHHRGGLNLAGEVSRLMGEGASTQLSVIACSTSDKWAESAIKDQTPTKLIGTVTGKKARDSVAELAGLPAAGRRALDSLPAKHFLYADHADGAEPALAITKAVASRY
jgi:hypothetical protein